MGPGNNGAMVRGLLKRRFWWVEGSEKEKGECQFVWTQVKVEGVFEGQKRAGRVEVVYREDGYDEEEEEKEKDKEKEKEKEKNSISVKKELLAQKTNKAAL